MSQQCNEKQQRIKSYLAMRPRRWLVIIIGLSIQVTLMVAALISLQQFGQPDVTLMPLAGQPNTCKITSVAMFTDAWINGIQPGMYAHALIDKLPDWKLHDTGTIVNCIPTSQSVFVQVMNQNTILHLNTAPRSIDIGNMVTTCLLAIIFSLTGITIYLRASKRPIARVAYVLFSSASLIFFFITTSDILWANILLYILGQITWGMAVAFVFLLPMPTRKPGKKHTRTISPYTPLIISSILTILSIPILFWFPQARQTTSLIINGYSFLCMMAIGKVIFWDMRVIRSEEKQIIRVIATGIVFLLLGLGLSHKVNYSSFVLNSPIHINTTDTVPLMILPIICGYALIRHQPLGTTRLLNRQVIRTLLWILLSSFFVVFCIDILHILENNIPGVGDNRDIFYGSFLWLSLLLFPLVWNKICNIGDRVFYHDFYEYNRSLRELSAELTRLQHLDQICTFILPRLTTLLNATGGALLIRAKGHSKEKTSPLVDPAHAWHTYLNEEQPFLPIDRLIGIVNLALTHQGQRSDDPLLLDGVLLFALYDGEYLSGFLCFGSKLNFEPYNRQDKSFLATLAAQLSILEANSRYLEQAEADAQQLSALNRRVVSAQEDERRHLALELHDEVLQHAMLLVRQLADASNMTEVAQAMPLARSLVSSLRQTCLELRPPLLDELGLEEALHWLASQTEQRSPDLLRINIYTLGTMGIRLPDNVELAFYRVVQEALSNIHKHARASRAIIRMRYSPSSGMSLLIWDNGYGFIKGQAANERLGLVGMHERMTAVNGQLHIRTTIGRGVTIKATYKYATYPTEVQERVEAIR